jgi:hypothetical protein
MRRFYWGIKVLHCNMLLCTILSHCASQHGARSRLKSNQIIQSDKEEPEMSIIEKQVQLGRELFEINAATVRRLVELQSEGVKQYFETNQDFAKRLPEVKDVSSFVELQREYGKTVWSNTQEGWQSGGEVVREAVENAGAAVRSAFNAEEPAAETA